MPTLPSYAYPKYTNLESRTSNENTAQNLRNMQGSLNGIDYTIKELTKSRTYSNYCSNKCSGLSDRTIYLINYSSFFVLGGLTALVPILPSISLVISKLSGKPKLALALCLPVLATLGLVSHLVAEDASPLLISTERVDRAKKSYEKNHSKNYKFYNENLDTFKRNIISDYLENINKYQQLPLNTEQLKEKENDLMNILNSKKDDTHLEEIDIEYSTIEKYNEYFEKQHKALGQELDFFLQSQGSFTKPART